MSRQKRAPAHDLIEQAIRRAGTIGAVERLAGIGSTPEARQEFWRPYTGFDGAEGLELGVAELKRRVRALPWPPRDPQYLCARSAAISSMSGSSRSGVTPSCSTHAAKPRMR